MEELEKILENNSTEKLCEKYTKLCEEYDRIGGYTYKIEYNKALKNFGFSEEDKHKKIGEFSGGQRTKIALIKLLLSKPDMLILDEPTNGLDSASKLALSSALKQLKETGMTIVAVTHDAEFAADTADRCAMFFRGQNVCAAPSRDFFKSGSFYTTPFVPMTKGFFEDTPVTLADTVAAYSQAICRRKQAAALNGETTARCDTAPRNETAGHDESVARSGRAVGCDEPSCRENNAVLGKCPQEKGGRK